LTLLSVKHHRNRKAGHLSGAWATMLHYFTGKSHPAWREQCPDFSVKICECF